MFDNNNPYDPRNNQDPFYETSSKKSSPKKRRALIIAGKTVLCLLLTAGYNDTAYYPSLTDPQSSLTIYNSSSSRFTLYVMSIVSLLIPFVVAYIWYVWRSMNRVRISEKELGKEDHPY